MKRTNLSKWTYGIFAIVMMAGGLIACGGSGGGFDGNRDPYANCAQPCYNGPLGAGIVPVNQQYVGYYSQTNNFYLPGYANAGSVMSIRSGMQTVLKEAMGVCDREYISGGMAGCASWLNGAHDLVILSDRGSTNNTVKLIIRSVPSQQISGGWYSYSLPNFEQLIFGMLGFNMNNPSGVFDPLVLNATIWPVNNSQGFEVRTNGPRQSYAWNKLFQLIVTNGKLEDSSWSYKLYYNSILAAEGTSVRCQTQFCGLDASYYNVAQ